MIDTIFSLGQGMIDAPWWTGLAWPVAWAMAKIVAVLMLVMGAVTYTTLWERKLLGWVQIRLGPNRVGPWGLLQPIADAMKLMTKEVLRRRGVITATQVRAAGPVIDAGDRRELDALLADVADLLPLPASAAREA